MTDQEFIQEGAKLELLKAIKDANEKLAYISAPSTSGNALLIGRTAFQIITAEIIALSQELRAWEGVPDATPDEDEIDTEKADRIGDALNQAVDVVAAYREVEIKDTCKADTQFFCSVEALDVALNKIDWVPA